MSFFDDTFASDETRRIGRIPTESPTERIAPVRLPSGPTTGARRSTAGSTTTARHKPAGSTTTGRHGRKPEPVAPPTPARHARPLPTRSTPTTPTPRNGSRRADVGGPLPGHVAGQRTRRRRGRSLIWRIATTATGFTVLLVLMAGAAAGLVYEKYNSQIKRVSVLQTHDSHIRNPAKQQHAENFLMIGSDTREGADAKFGNEAGARSDTTILVHLSPDRTKATAVSIPRDSWVDIPTCVASNGSKIPAHQDMFNSAFSVGGPKCTIATVQKLTGIAVTHFVEIDFSGFESMVNAMGTVTICSPERVRDPYSGLSLRAGNNRLNGAGALAYVRARETLGDGSDLGRIKRQQAFLGAVLRQAMTGSMLTNPTRLTSFLDAATKAITVDKGTTFGDLRALATSMQGLDPRHVTFYTAPIANQNYTPPGTNMTGRVLLDATEGRVLYDSIINDTKPVWVKKVDGHSTVVHSSTSPSAAHPPPTHATRGTPTPTTPATPKASINAAQRTCSL